MSAHDPATVELRPCPFCAGPAEITKHFKEECWRLLHRCPVVGAIALDWTAPRDRLVSQWNKRAALDEVSALLAEADACIWQDRRGSEIMGRDEYNRRTGEALARHAARATKEPAPNVERVAHGPDEA